MSIGRRIRRIHLLASTLRHLTRGQVSSRLARIARTRWLGIRGATVSLPAAAPIAPHQPLWIAPESPGDEAEGHIRQAREIERGTFRFLNHEVTFVEEIQWSAPGQARLWRFHLHYFDFVLDLAMRAWAGERAAAFETFRRVARSWMDSNRKLAGDGWHPYTISLRAVNWCRAFDVFGPELAADPSFSDALAKSLFAQLRFLARNIEYDVRGNHIIENLRALIWGGTFFSGPEPAEWCRTGLAVLEKELAEQVACDGGHFERTPGYHTIVLRELLEIAVWLRRNAEARPWLDEVIRRMLDFLDAIVMADGRLPLLKDTTFDGPEVGDLLNSGAIYLRNAQWKRSAELGLYPRLLFGAEGKSLFDGMPFNDQPRRTRFLADSGFAVVREPSSGDSFIIDVGPPSPSYLSAHAHADLFSFELVLNGQRAIVDSGVGIYEGGLWRDFFRSTAAHNTVEVSGENQSEVWSSFRMGRRARPSAVRFEERGRHVLIQGEHDGYLRLPVPVRHRRTAIWLNRERLVVIDELFGGSGMTAAVSRLHYHPGFDPAEISVSPFGFSEETMAEAWYSERFGQNARNRVLVLRLQGEIPMRFGYVIGRRQTEVIVRSDVLHVGGAMIPLARPMEAELPG